MQQRLPSSSGSALVAVTAILGHPADELVVNPERVRFMAQFDALYARDCSAEQLLALEARVMPSAMGETMNRLSTPDVVTLATEDSAAVLDVIGLNYADSRYELDAERFPNGVIVGSETFPAHIDEPWRLGQAHPHVS